MTWIERTIVQAWDAPLDVVIYPINADESEESRTTIDNLKPEDFSGIDSFLQRELRRYGIKRVPAVAISLQPELKSMPPLRMQNSGLQNALWSLKLRWWNYRQGKSFLPMLGQVRLYVLFHRLEAGVALEHSLGLQKGLIGVVHVFAEKEMYDRNNVVIAHELLHTLGATDKYRITDNQPVYPEGYADHYRKPLHPQHDAEIMAGRMPLSENESSMPENLERCVIGAKTAQEINFAGGFARQYGK